MAVRWEYQRIITDAQQWGTLLFGDAGSRSLRLGRLRGRRLAQSMTGELTCRELLSELAPNAGYSLEEDSEGRPFVPGSPLHISISHSGGYVAAAVADRPVGIDLQELREISDAVLRRWFSPAERSWIEAGESKERAIRLWTMKEAWGKLHGKGIFSGKPFFAEITDGGIALEYDGLRFLFPEAPDGLLFSVCLSK